MRGRHATRAVLAGVAVALAAVLAGLPVAVKPALAQGNATACPPGVSSVRIRAATYVALGKDLLFRLQVEGSIDAAVLIMNKVDGNRLYDRTYWKPVKVAEQCGQRTIDYVDEDEAGAAAPPMRLVYEPAEEIRRPGLPRPMVVFAGAVVLPSGERQALQFEEVVIKREVGAPAPKR
ncbi:MAG: hypothetical protein ACK515_24975 [bacterium]|nr:hypothetical protein [Betaproteobacteria bacterium]